MFLATLEGEPTSGDKKLLSSSHVAIVTVNREERRGVWSPTEISASKVFKGNWRPKILIAIPQEKDGLKIGRQYLVYASERIVNDALTICAYWEDVILLEPSSVAQTSDRIGHIVKVHRDAIAAALQHTSLDFARDNRVVENLALLFRPSTQREAVHGLLALPPSADRVLALYVYDTRPIPRSFFSPDETIKFDASPVVVCQTVQEVVVWVLGMRQRQHFGAFDEASSECRMAIADAWFYWVVAAK
ncbi:MAG TPA: hypothetical protein PKX00_17445 [Opitutaceae bacterium]|nr:hypothetical protein [Opitutaceae bacterium]